MNKALLIAFVALLAPVAAHGAEPAAAPAKPAQSVPAGTPAAAPKPATPAVAQKTAAVSQQDRMRNCNKQAAGKKGAERKAFMKSCLSTKT